MVRNKPVGIWSRYACAFKSCTPALRKRVSNLSWHRIPSGNSRELWIKNIQDSRGDPGWVPKASSNVCCRHFSRDCFYKQGDRTFLKVFSVPTESKLEYNEEGTHDDIGDLSEDSETAESIPEPQSLSEDTGTAESLPEPQDLSEDTGTAESTPETPDSTSKVVCPNCQHCFSLTDIPAIDNEEPLSKKSRESSPMKTCSQERSQSSPAAATKSHCKPVTPKSYLRLRAEHTYIRSPTTTAVKELSRRRMWESRFHASRKQVRRLNFSLNTVKIELQKSKILSEERLTLLENQFPNILKKLISNESRSCKLASTKGMRYDDEIKKFAVTLHYYSSKAYDFVREYLTLPHPSTLTSWMRSSNCNPGFNIEVLDRIRDAKLDDKRNMLSDVGLQLDEMSIRKETCWDQNQHKFMGFVDLGSGELTGDEPLATNALVCMLTGLTGGWKVSIGYILTDKVDGSQMKSFTSRAFELLEERNFNVLSLTSDGNTANVAMFEKLGVQEKFDDQDLRYEAIINSFPNPAANGKKVGCIYDMIHMMKLWRNLVAQCSNIKWENEYVSWKYIVQVHKLQEYEKIVAANKLGRYHIDFQKHKMKTKYALQSFSLSVADAIDFCRDDLELPDFVGSEATSRFIRKLDACFDILNSRHPSQHGNKSPLRAENINSRAAFLEEFSRSILDMSYEERTNRKGKVSFKTKLICQGARKRAVVGTVITVKSILDISYEVLLRNESPHKYVLTYRFCQDLLELFFNKVRGNCGRNNNPNAVEFKNIMKKIWHSNLLKSSSTGNCIIQQAEGQIPGGLLPLKRRPEVAVELGWDGDLCFELPESVGFNECSAFYNNCLAYIAGNITRVLSERLKCETCIGGLLQTNLDPIAEKDAFLINRKQRGGLYMPCLCVLILIKKTDSILKEMIKRHNGPPRINNLDIVVARNVLKFCIGRNLFPQLSGHVLDFDAEDGESHYGILIKAVVKQFVKIRMSDYGKRYQKSSNLSLRHNLTKQIVMYRHE